MINKINQENVYNSSSKIIEPNSYNFKNRVFCEILENINNEWNTYVKCRVYEKYVMFFLKNIKFNNDIKQFYITMQRNLIVISNI